MDTFASEYGWSIDYILSLPIDAVEQLRHSLLYRRGLQPRLVNDDPSEFTGTLAERMKAILDAPENIEDGRAEN